jgi:hypothetical protein
MTQPYLAAKRQVVARALKRRTRVAIETDQMPLELVTSRLLASGVRLAGEPLESILKLMPRTVPVEGI